MSTTATALAPETAPGGRPPGAGLVDGLLASAGGWGRVAEAVAAATSASRVGPQGKRLLLVAASLVLFIASAWYSAPVLALPVLFVPLVSMSRRAMRGGAVAVAESPARREPRDDGHALVEALVLAVEAKDAATHGHVRRVQALAVELAVSLGMNDPVELEALSLAALLHDLGKLEVPEAILNKPAALTADEMVVMRGHAGVGAALVATLGMRYPIVPIVRHHHENWDGSGYPSGLAGADIPLAARILSVADCYDALTSDRPYRAALAPGEALGTLLARRGTMYDPRVVDVFVYGQQRH